MLQPIKLPKKIYNNKYGEISCQYYNDNCSNIYSYHIKFCNYRLDFMIILINTNNGYIEFRVNQNNINNIYYPNFCNFDRTYDYNRYYYNSLNKKLKEFKFRIIYYDYFINYYNYYNIILFDEAAHTFINILKDMKKFKDTIINKFKNEKIF